MRVFISDYTWKYIIATIFKISLNHERMCDCAEFKKKKQKIDEIMALIIFIICVCSQEWHGVNDFVAKLC